jgi:hypothetical protein
MIAAALGWSAALYAACAVVIVGSAIWFLMKPSCNMVQPEFLSNNQSSRMLPN